jgi:hypothetical protein
MTKLAAPMPGCEVAKRYEPTAEERAAVVAHTARRKRRSTAPRIKLSDKGGAIQVGTDHPQQSLGQVLVMQALGTTDIDFFNGLVDQLINAGTQGKQPDERTLNFMLAAIKAMEPRDEAECMLTAQMAAVHMATMTFARRLNHVDNIAQQDSASNAFNKLARTFAVQLEALKRYRTGGEQKVTVQHNVTVNQGGQAIVGTVSQASGGGGGPGNRETAP